jgi:hypothetical protein
MYYYIRESFQETAISEGFCKELCITGEMLKGEIKIDGLKRINLDMGDKIRMSLNPKFNLNCIRFI